MRKKISIGIIIFLLAGIALSSSGCIEKNSNNTWGEKKISLDEIKVDNDTIGKQNERNNSIYYVEGNVTNFNQYDAFNLKIKITTYDPQGNVFLVNNTPYLDQKTIAAHGKLYFYAKFIDPEKKIVRFDVKVVDAKAEYGT